MVRLILSGIVFIIGINVLLALRDARLFKQIDNRNTQIEQLLQS